jgi:hypothetical protein
LKNNLLAMSHFDLMMNLMCDEATKCTEVSEIAAAAAAAAHCTLHTHTHTQMQQVNALQLQFRGFFSDDQQSSVASINHQELYSN